MTVRVLIAVLILETISFQASNSAPQPVWLVIASTEQTASAVLGVKAALRDEWPNSTVVRSNDCKNLKQGLYLLSIGIFRAHDEAKRALKQLQAWIPDAYLRKCIMEKPSLLSLGIPLIHPSIEHAPVDVVNWSDNDRTSELIMIRGLGVLLLERRYDPQDESMLEGRSQSVYVIRSNQSSLILLEKNCLGLGGIQYYRNMNLLAFHCERGIAADHIVHTSKVITLNPVNVVFEQPWCRNPQVKAGKVFTCEKELVDAEGDLSLRRKSFP
ncbi:MAG: hypothetical protein ETSY2_30600 [Candidatus Entotheonella gemina]|uniref:SPOR domain-containing protein n=1 Tax=Candidatus Entotheonella gemina TaxID=1429439 RepID=W4M1U7_9BACT|nr:MAG: hypothetical protein ETSY2_30600 [Candidatus Entotheonella gemina]